MDSAKPEFDDELTSLLARGSALAADVQDVVMGIIADVRQRGDAALIDYTNRFDQRKISEFTELEVSKAELDAAKEKISPEVLAALTESAARITAYHEKQKQESWRYTDEHGNQLGQIVRALDRVGLYVPGGKASYPSSVLMTALPAKVAGVEEITLVAPSPGGELNDTVLAAAAICGVDRYITVGGAQAVAALAYGTESLSAVDKIVGPGNIYVATAKQMVFGDVGIDIIAGPSEVVIIADDSANAEWIVMDLFAQAEHDEQAQSILISPSDALLQRVDKLINEQISEMDRAAIIAKSWQGRGALIKVKDLEEAVAISNKIAPEHLEIAINDPESVLDSIRHAGAIFLGHYSAESVGDYSAGPSHVLPTAGTARFSSPLGVYDFQKRSSLIKCSEEGARVLGNSANVLAREEGLIAHALSAQYRMKGSNK